MIGELVKPGLRIDGGLIMVARREQAVLNCARYGDSQSWSIYAFRRPVNPDREQKRRSDLVGSMCCRGR
jgi:hypothetical protein